MRIVFDHDRAQWLPSLARYLSWFAGIVLLALGLVAAVAALPSGLVLLLDVVTYFQQTDGRAFEPDFPLREVEAAFAVAVLTAFVGLRFGLRLVRGTRRTVLFLRRFGFDGAQQAVTFAVASTIGATWRLVTLDDAEMAPLGVDPAARFIVDLGRPLGRLATIASQAIVGTFTWTIYGMLGVIGLEVARAPGVGRLLENGTADRYLAIIERVASARLPDAYVDASLTGVFAVLATGFAISFIGLGVMVVTLLAPIPLAPFVWMAASTARAVREAETLKTASVQHPTDISRVVREVARRTQRVFAPRLVVVRVETLLWPATVRALAAASAAVIIDISEPSENVLWELGEVEQLCAGRDILIAEEASIRGWSGRAGGPESLIARFERQLGDRDVLAYTTDAAGMRRFARAMRGRLLDVPSRPVMNAGHRLDSSV